MVKHRLSTPVSPLQVVRDLLALPSMHGLLEGSAVWLAVQPPTLHALEHAVVGLTDGGPATAQRTLAALTTAAPPTPDATGEQAPPVSVRLSLPEAMFLVHALQHLTVYRRARDGPATPLSPEVCFYILAKSYRHPQQLWTACCDLKPQFAQSYVAMQHYRLKVCRKVLQRGT